MEFIDTTSPTYPIVASPKHFSVNLISWDPSGRYLLSAFTQDVESSEGRARAYAVRAIVFAFFLFC
jgi:hypothetical protein